MSEAVKLKVDGVVHEGWTSITITRVLNAACTTFELSVTEALTQSLQAAKVRPGAACELWIGDELIVTGWVGRRAVHTDDRSHSISLSGRDRTGDLIDCSVVTPPSYWRNQKLQRIAADLLKPFGLTLHVEADTGAKIAYFAIEQGETVFAALERMAKLKGLLIGTRPDGQPRLFSPKPTRGGYTLELGRNLLAIDTEDSVDARFSTYTVKAQQRGGNDIEPDNARAVSATVKDAAMTRHRPLVIISDDQSSLAGVKARAAWEATAHMAEAQSVSVEVAGWRAEDGTLYAPGVLVPVKALSHDVDLPLVVSEVVLSLSEDSWRTALTLTRPESFTQEPLPEPKPKKTKKKKGQAVDGLTKVQ